MSATPESAFDRDTAVEALGGGRYGAFIAENWNVVDGPNGGFLAALFARSLAAELAEPDRALRSITVHYLRRPTFAEAEIEVEVLRTGRSLATLAATMVQNGKPMATALAAYSVPWDTPLEFRRDLPAHAHEPGIDLEAPPGPRHFVNFDTDHRLDAPFFSGEGSTRSAGWIRTADPRPLDAIALVAISDALPPAIFPRITAPIAVPTVDLTVHIRAALPHPGLADDDQIYAEFTTDHVADGFLEEDGAMWSPDGTLLAQSRQLAIAR